MRYNNKKRRSKYNAVATVVDGIRFASKKEAARYVQLKLLKKAGEISWFTRQPSYDLAGGIKYKGDFLVVKHLKNIVAVNIDGTKTIVPACEVRVEDVKGVLTDVFKLKRKLLKEAWGIDLKLI